MKWPARLPLVGGGGGGVSPCRDTKFSVTTQGEPTLSLQETLCSDRAPKEGCHDKPFQAWSSVMRAGVLTVHAAVPHVATPL